MKKICFSRKFCTYVFVCVAILTGLTIMNYLTNLHSVTTLSNYRNALLNIDQDENTSDKKETQSHRAKILKLYGLEEPYKKYEFASNTANETLYEKDDYFNKRQHLYEMEGIDCPAILKRNKTVIADAIDKLKFPEWTGFKLDDQYYTDLAADCNAFLDHRGYIMSSLSSVEEAFPLAFSLLIYKDIEQVERLFRSVYRPHNTYCIHVDKKATEEFWAAISSIAACLPNVHLAPRIDVWWGDVSLLEAEISCMKVAQNKSDTWKYYINLTGQEFPLKTNRELVEILMAYKGANEVQGKRRLASIDYKFRWKDFLPAPMWMEPSKGEIHVLVNREFVRFITVDPRAKSLLEWVRPQKMPDETYFSMINHNPHLQVLGSFVGLDDVEKMMALKPYYGRYKAWTLWPCAGVRIRSICILSTGDLWRLGGASQFIANKFFMDEDRIAYGCLEQLLFNRTREYATGVKTANADFYAESLIVHNRFDKFRMY